MMNIFSFVLIDLPSTQASSVFEANDPIYVFKNPSHLTYENMANLQIDNDQSFISQLQQNPWIHLDLGLERFIDSVTVTMNPQNLTELYIYIGYEIPNVSKENVLPLEINTLCGHIELDSAQRCVLPVSFLVDLLLKVAFSQKGLMRSSFLQTDEPNYFPELEF